MDAPSAPIIGASFPRATGAARAASFRKCFATAAAEGALFRQDLRKKTRERFDRPRAAKRRDFGAAFPPLEHVALKINHRRERSAATQMHRELARPAFEQAPGSRPAPDRACDLHDLLSDETDLLIAADLIVAATGSWAAESALNCRHNRSRPPSACRLWLDRGARLRRARRRDRERRGLPWMSHRADRRTVVQSRGVAGRGRRQSREPACGAHYQPSADASAKNAEDGDIQASPPQNCSAAFEATRWNCAIVYRMAGLARNSNTR